MQLETLAIHYGLVAEVDFKPFVGVLRSCSRLIRLTLEHIRCTAAGIAPKEAISFPLLQSLTIINVGYNLAIPLLASIKAPSLAELIIEYNYPRGPVSVGIGLLDRPDPPPSIASMLTNSNFGSSSIDIEIDHNSLEIKGFLTRNHYSSSPKSAI